jgi:LPXTG-motif cell wall-anchored protein
VEAGTIDRLTDSSAWWIALVAVPWIVLLAFLLLRRRRRTSS